MGDGLVEQRQRIAHRTFGRARDGGERSGLDVDAFVPGDGPEMLDELVGLDAPQVETLTARQHRHRHFADFRRGEDELHMWRRLFQRLQEAVERLLRQHVHFVDDIDLVAGRGRGIARAFDDLADVVDAGAGGRVHFLDIHMPRLGNGDARVAHAARLDRGLRRLAVGAYAVERARDDAGRRRLSHAADARQHEGMGDAAGGEGVLERLDERFLPDQAGEILRAVFAREHAIGFALLRRRIETETQVFAFVHGR